MRAALGFLDPAPQSVYIHRLQPQMVPSFSEWLLTIMRLCWHQTNWRNMRKHISAVDCSCRSGWYLSDLLRFHLKKNKQGFKETRTRKTDVICLFWDQCDSHLSFKTFLSAPLALSSFFFFFLHQHMEPQTSRESRQYFVQASCTCDRRRRSGT